MASVSAEEVSLQGPAPTAWLLEGPAFVRYRTLVDILGCPREDREARQVRAAVPRDPAVRRLLKQRNDEGYWQGIETYIREHTTAEFSHSICNDCMEKHYPDIYAQKNNEKNRG